MRESTPVAVQQATLLIIWFKILNFVGFIEQFSLWFEVQDTAIGFCFFDLYQMAAKTSVCRRLGSLLLSLLGF